MTRLLQRIADIEYRIKQSPTAPWTWDNGYTGVPGDEPYAVLRMGGEAVSRFDDLRGSSPELICHAPADLAYLARLLRTAAEAPCSIGEWGARPYCVARIELFCKHRSVTRDHPDTIAAWHELACWPCKIREAGERE